jgi:RNA polymerase sigma factor (sigma-70 family)
MGMRIDAGEESVMRVPALGRAQPNAATRAEAAVTEIFSRCESRIGRYLLQMVGDRLLAEDLLQDTFVAALRGHVQVTAADSGEAWLFGIARNQALAALRKGRRRNRALDLLSRRRTSEADNAEEIVAARDLLERHLSPDDRALVLLRYLHGFDAVELAAMTGRSAEAVRQRLSRARATLVQASVDAAPAAASRTSEAIKED